MTEVLHNTVFRKVPFLDLRINDPEVRASFLQAIDAVFLHGRLVMGPEVQELESRVAAFCNRKYAVGVNSGTDALFMALKSFGIGPGDEVITTSLSWIATANAIALVGATPVFADIREDLNIDPNSIKRLITSRTKAILPVHYTGKICDMDALTGIAQEYGLLLIEDAAQAFGAYWKGRIAGSFGNAACFSMNPMKIFGACGEAGMVVTDSEDICERLVMLRYNGTINREECLEPGLNGRMDTLQAAILLKRLDEVERIINRRREIANWYTDRLKEVLKTPREDTGSFDIYYTYTVRTPQRDALKQFLQNRGIETKIQHPILMPYQKAYDHLTKPCIPVAERVVREILCLPAHEKMFQEDMEYVVDCIKEFFQNR